MKAHKLFFGCFDGGLKAIYEFDWGQYFRKWEYFGFKIDLAGLGVYFETNKLIEVTIELYKAHLLFLLSLCIA